MTSTCLRMKGLPENPNRKRSSEPAVVGALVDGVSDPARRAASKSSRKFAWGSVGFRPQPRCAATMGADLRGVLANRNDPNQRSSRRWE
jgi:hypothetical protein